MEPDILAYGVEDLGSKLLPVVDYIVIRSAVRVDPLLQERGGNCGCHDFRKQNTPLHYG